jgi:hypothetical protein
MKASRRYCHIGWVVAFSLVSILGAQNGTSAQVEPYSFKFNSGQNIQPIFEGWARDADGSFNFHFGYLNRNYAEDLAIPIGRDNSIMPDGPDRGQPTYFYSRINRNAFSVTVPKDWGTKKLIWTVTVRGKTERAVGWLDPQWEASPVNPSDPPRGQPTKNRPPTIDIPAVEAITLPSSLTLTAAVTDDGLPKWGAVRRQDVPPTWQQPPGLPEIPVNVPQAVPQAPTGNVSRGAGSPVEGPAVSWIVWRGPAAVSFSPRGSRPVEHGQAVVEARFGRPGVYVLRARATDGALSTVKDVTVTVSGPPSR